MRITTSSPSRLAWGLILCLTAWLNGSLVQAQSPAGTCVLIAFQGDVRISQRGRTNWVRATTNLVLTPGTQVRTGPNSEATIRVGGRGVQKLGPNSGVQASDPAPTGAVRQFLERGRHYFFDGDGGLEINTSTASGLTLGTEFAVQVEGEGESETVEVTLFDGAFELRNALDKVRLESGEQGRSEPGKPPFKTAAIYSTRVVQWCLYYPAVLDPAELVLPPDAATALAESLARYRAGDLVGAWAAWPEGRQPVSAEERVYHAALQLALGGVDEARAELEGTAAGGTAGPWVAALRRVIAAVTQEGSGSGSVSESVSGSVSASGSAAVGDPGTASGWLAESYFAQSRNDLERARQLARQAVARSPEFGFAWARLAELELGRGDLRGAAQANRRARALAPRHAQAVVVEGFLLAAQNRTRRAREVFSQAITLDPRLGNAWLGRGLTQFRLGQREAGRADLSMAAAVEPTRAALRSALAKGWQENREAAKAKTELKLAARLDPADPTVPYYAALLAYGENRINDAIGRLEQAIALNDNRAVFRPQAQLDEDRAVRGTGLARLYQRAGLTEVSLREAARAVASDYSDYSSHLFLAETYDALRDPTRFNLRYETAWFNELLLADLLAPAGAGTFSPNVSQQEYSRLFTAEGLALTSVSDYRNDGQWRQLVTQSGFFGNTAWSLDLDYRRHDGVRPNNELDAIEWYTQLKHQVTAQDTALVLLKYQDYHSGDNFQYLDPLAPGTGFSRSFQYDESQTPIAVAGWRHEWSPGIQTLLLAGRLENDQSFRQDPVGSSFLILDNGQLASSESLTGALDFRSRLEIYTGELSQILRWDQHTVVLGGRAQRGSFDTTYRLDSNDFLGSILFPDQLNTSVPVSAGFDRWTVYGYETWTPWQALSVTAGVTYEALSYPENFRAPPLNSEEASRSRLLPKAAVVWTPTSRVTIRGMYAQSLGGVSLDESFRLEPVQLAGFSQAFRTLIPESVVGSVSAPGFDVGGMALDLKLPARTYVGLRGDILRSRVDREIGAYTFDQGTQVAGIRTTAERLDYEEESAAITVDKLLGEEWSVGGLYRFQSSRLESGGPELGQNPERLADLHEFTLRATWNHGQGWFGRAESRWLLQAHENATRVSGRGDEDTCQVNVQFGWRFPRQKGELSLGILNLIGDDYRLAPLSGVPELARERVFFGRLKLFF